MVGTIWLLETLFFVQIIFFNDWIVFCFIVFWMNWLFPVSGVCLEGLVPHRHAYTLVPHVFPVWLCVGSVPFLCPAASFLDR